MRIEFASNSLWRVWGLNAHQKWIPCERALTKMETQIMKFIQTLIIIIFDTQVSNMTSCVSTHDTIL